MEYLWRTIILLAASNLSFCVAHARMTILIQIILYFWVYLYTIYSSARYYDNEIFHFNWEINNIFSQSTNDLKCCITFNITKTVVLPGNYFPYHLATDPSCSVKVNEDAVMKLLYKAYIGGERCLILWTCRSSRKGVHAWCNTPNVSTLMDVWIKERYAYLNLDPQPIIQQVNYKNGPCFTHNRRFNMYW